MQTIPSMKAITSISLIVPVIFLCAGVAGCGDDSSGDTAQPPTGPTAAAGTQSGNGSKPGGNGQGSAPASAGDKPDGDAPDDVISDRPGGPKDQGKDKPSKKPESDGSGGISPPVTPSPVR